MRIRCTPSPSRPNLFSILTAVLLLFVLGLTPTAAQQEVLFTDELDFDGPEAWAHKFFTSLSMLSPLGTPREMKPGEIELGFETGLVPHLDQEQRTVGFRGTKEEDLNRSDVFGRARVLIGLPKNFSLTVGYVPPIELNGAKPNLLSVALGRPFLERERVRLGWRIYGQVGTIEGDFTCSAEDAAAGADPIRNPFFCREASNDELKPRYVAFEVSTAFTGGERFTPYIAVAVNHLDVEFQVNALYGDFLDRTLQLADGTTWAFTAGTTYRLNEKFELVGEAFYTPLDVVRQPRVSPESENDPLFNVRAMVRYKWR